MEIKGTIINVLPLESGVSKTNGNPWSKATIIIETEGQFPKKVAMSNMKQAEEFARLPIGARGTFKIDVESREYNKRWYSEIRCYAYELEGQQAPQPQYQQPQMPQGGYAQSPQSSGYQQPPQGYTQSYAQPTQNQFAPPPQGYRPQSSDDEIPF